MKISVLIIARNEESVIEDTLKSVSFVDEIVVILDRSVDQTKSICKKYTKKIFSGSWLCEGKEEIMVLKCTSDWILEIDADEIVTKNLKEEILKKKDWWNLIFFYIKLLNFVGSQPIKHGWISLYGTNGKFCFFKKKKQKNGMQV